jgi:uncharacterized protein RhaS with RHS repeats
VYYYRNRYYSPQTGRFISEDPTGWASGQTNAYAYVGGNPVSYRDSRGTNPLAGVIAGGEAGSTLGPAGTIAGGIIGGIIGGIVAGDVLGPMFSDGDDPVVYPDNPGSAKDKFQPITGTPGKLCPSDGSVWEKDTAGHGNRDGDGPQWKRWPDKKAWESGKKPQSIWPDGRIRK